MRLIDQVFVGLWSLFKYIDFYETFTYVYVYFKRSTDIRGLKGDFHPWQLVVYGRNMLQYIQMLSNVLNDCGPC